MNALHEAQLKAAVSRHVNDEDMIELVEQAEQVSDSLEFWRSAFARISEPESGTDAATEDDKLLAEYKLNIETIKESVVNEVNDIVRHDLVGYLICRRTSFGPEYCDRRVAWTANRGECIPFLDEMEARTTALSYAASMAHGATQHKNLPQQISITLTVCPSVPEPSAGVRVGKELSVQHTRALDAVKAGCLAANILGRDGKAVDTYAAAADYLLWCVDRAIRR